MVLTGKVNYHIWETRTATGEYMCCIVTENDGQDAYHGFSIIQENHYFNSEADFCRVYSEEVRRELEELLLWSRVSYFIVDQNTTLLSRVFGLRKRCWLFRINRNDLEYAMQLVEDMRGVEVIAQPPARDWVPVEAKRRREQLRKAGV